MPDYRHERLPNSPQVSNPNHWPGYSQSDAQRIAREGPRHPLDSDDPYVRWQYLVDHRLIGGNPPQPQESLDNINRWEIALGLRPTRPLHPRQPSEGAFEEDRA